MMREIKFRAWDKRNKCWSIEPLYIDEEGRLYEIYERSFAFENYMHKEYVSEEHDVCWYTGLKDKNGVEIYEGDVVRCNYTCDKREWPEYKSNITEESTPEFVVNFVNGGFVISYTQDYSQWCPWSSVGLSQFRWREQPLSDGVTNEYTQYVKDFGTRTHQRLFNLEVIGNIYENPELIKTESE